MLFRRARQRLTLLYVAMFAIVLICFSAAFFIGLALVLEPDFDVGPELTNDQAAQVAYRATVERIGVALVAADLLVIGVVAIAAWILAARTLRPIREAHERQRRFVADASHEMRSPLAAIRSTTENALVVGASDADRTAALEIVADASARMTRLTADLLLLAQSDDASVRRVDEPLDLSVVVAEALGPHLAEASERSRLTVSLAAGLAGRGDPDEISHIVENLVDNAFRYGGPLVRVRVLTRSGERDLTVEVGDDGPGLSAGDRPHVFEAFYRVRSDASAPTGTGLGLAIAANLAKRNRGRLTVESHAGNGATFRLTLPRAR